MEVTVSLVKQKQTNKQITKGKNVTNQVFVCVCVCAPVLQP